MKGIGVFLVVITCIFCTASPPLGFFRRNPCGFLPVPLTRSPALTILYLSTLGLLFSRWAFLASWALVSPCGRCCRHHQLRDPPLFLVLRADCRHESSNTADTFPISRLCAQRYLMVSGNFELHHMYVPLPLYTTGMQKHHEKISNINTKNSEPRVKAQVAFASNPSGCEL